MNYLVCSIEADFRRCPTKQVFFLTIMQNLQENAYAGVSF